MFFILNILKNIKIHSDKFLNDLKAKNILIDTIKKVILDYLNRILQKVIVYCLDPKWF